MTSIKIIGNSTPFTVPKLETIIIGTYFQYVEHVPGGIVLTRMNEDQRVRTFIPYHRVWEIELIEEMT